jgi:DNA-binding XRE family transcriptional regulator
MWELARRLGVSVRSMRRCENCTQEEMAERLHIPIDTYIMLERGVLLPSQATFSTICRSLVPYPKYLTALSRAVQEPTRRNLMRVRRPERDKIILRIRSRRCLTH